MVCKGNEELSEGRISRSFVWERKTEVGKGVPTGWLSAMKNRFISGFDSEKKVPLIYQNGDLSDKRHVSGLTNLFLLSRTLSTFPPVFVVVPLLFSFPLYFCVCFLSPHGLRLSIEDGLSWVTMGREERLIRMNAISECPQDQKRYIMERSLLHFKFTLYWEIYSATHRF